jgi:hypothetical protein
MSLTEQILAEITLVNVIVTLVVSLIVIPFGVWAYDNYRFRKLPPGPPTRPFVGNKHLIPQSRPWLKMTEWSEQYVFLFSAGLILGSYVYFMAREISHNCDFRSDCCAGFDGEEIPDLFFET